MRRVMVADPRIQGMSRAVNAALAKVRNTNVREGLRAGLSDEVLICICQQYTPEEIRASIGGIVRSITASTWHRDPDNSAIQIWFSSVDRSALIAEIVAAVVECSAAYDAEE